MTGVNKTMMQWTMVNVLQTDKTNMICSNIRWNSIPLYNFVSLTNRKQTILLFPIAWNFHVSHLFMVFFFSDFRIIIIVSNGFWNSLFEKLWLLEVLESGEKKCAKTKWPNKLIESMISVTFFFFFRSLNTIESSCNAHLLCTTVTATIKSKQLKVASPNRMYDMHVIVPSLSIQLWLVVSFQLVFTLNAQAKMLY